MPPAARLGSGDAETARENDGRVQGGLHFYLVFSFSFFHSFFGPQKRLASTGEFHLQLLEILKCQLALNVQCGETVEMTFIEFFARYPRPIEMEEKAAKNVQVNMSIYMYICI